jgi:hypothetical protein
VKVGFSQKRRQIHHPTYGWIAFVKIDIIDMLKTTKIDGKSRAENLSIEEWEKLYGNYKKTGGLKIAARFTFIVPFLAIIGPGIITAKRRYMMWGELLRTQLLVRNTAINYYGCACNYICTLLLFKKCLLEWEWLREKDWQH